MKLTANPIPLLQIVKVLGLCIAGSVGIFLLGNYGVEGDFRNAAEESFFFSVMFVGSASLLITAVWKGLVIRDEIKRDQENAAAGVSEAQGRSQEGDQDPPVTDLSSVFVGFGVLASTVQVGIIGYYISTEDVFYRTVCYGLLPIVMILYLISLFAQPRRQDGRTMIFLRAHFISCLVCEAFFVFHEIRNGKIGFAVVSICRAILLTLLFHYALKVRSGERKERSDEALRILPLSSLPSRLVASVLLAANTPLVVNTVLTP